MYRLSKLNVTTIGKIPPSTTNTYISKLKRINTLIAQGTIMSNFQRYKLCDRKRKGMISFI